MASVNEVHLNFDDDRISYKFCPARGNLSLQAMQNRGLLDEFTLNALLTTPTYQF